MNWIELETNWDNYRTVLRSYFSRLDAEDFESIKRDRGKLIESIELKYHFTAAEAADAVCEFEKDVRRPGAVK